MDGIQHVCEVIKRETGENVAPETLLDSLKLDSLEFMDLLVAIGEVPDNKIGALKTVRDIAEALC